MNLRQFTAVMAAALFVSTVAAQRIDLPARLLAEGRVTASAAVDIRAPLSGTVLQVHFREGDVLRAGQLLFTLDAGAAEAQLARARDRASQLRERMREALALQGGAALRSGTDIAALVAAEADVRSARLAVQRARIVAPVGCRAGRPTVQPGSAVQPAMPTPLVTLLPLETPGVDFRVPEKQLRALLVASAARELRIRLEGDAEAREARLLVIGHGVDPATGMIDVRAEWHDPPRTLRPGALARVTLEAGSAVAGIQAAFSRRR